MKRINVNNGGFIEIESTGHGITVTHCDSMGYVEERNMFSNDEIVMVLNLLSYMRDNDSKCAYAFPYREEEYRRFFSTNIDHGNLVEFRIFQ